MYLSKLNLLNFKNYENIDIEFSKKINCIIGLNGSGKTNLLDAIHYLAITKSFFNNIDYENIRHGCEFAIIQGIFLVNNINEEIFCCIQKNKKKIFKRNKNEYQKLSDHIGFIPLVFISPNDYKLIIETGEERRRFINNIISQYNRNYLENLINYNKILLQRNKILKDFYSGAFPKETFEVYNFQLNNYGNVIINYRREFFQQFIPVFKKYYEYIANNRENVSIIYESSIFDNNYLELLDQSFEKDLSLGYTSIGPHKDHIKFLLNENDIKKIGSQGQQKTFTIALKLAQYEFLKDKRGIKPLILLDDIFDRLDEKRVNRLIELILQDNFGQIFITHTEETGLKSILKNAHYQINMLRIENNNISIIL